MSIINKNCSADESRTRTDPSAHGIGRGIGFEPIEEHILPQLDLLSSFLC